MNEVEFNDSLRREAELLPDITTTIDRVVTRIAERVRQLRPKDLLLHSWWMKLIGDLPVQAESDVGPDQTLAMRMIDYVQSVIVSVPPAMRQREVTDDDIKQLRDDVEELFGLINDAYFMANTAKRQLKDPTYDEDREVFEFRAQLHWCNVRGDRYSQHFIEQLVDFISPHTQIVQELFGISASTFVEGIKAVVDSISIGVNQAREDFFTFQREVFEATQQEFTNVDHEVTDLAAFMRDVVKKRGWISRRDRVMDRFFGAGLFDLQNVAALPDELLQELSWKPGENAEFFADGQMKGWPLRLWPIAVRPFINIEGRYYCFDLYSLQDNLYRVMQRLIFRLRPGYRTEWNTKQMKIAETRVVSILAELLPGARVFKNVFYLAPSPTGKTEWHETDGLLLYDNQLLVVEIKGGSFTWTDPTTDFPAHIRSAKNLIESPAKQGERFLSYLKSAPKVAIFDASHAEIGRLERDHFKDITICAVSIDHLTELASQAEYLQPLGVNLPNTFVWSISLDDLRVIRDVLREPLVFLHYLRQRRRAMATPGMRVDDELDHLGMYLQHNEYSTQSPGAGTAPPSWIGYRDRVDKYYHQLRTDPEQAVPPAQEIPIVLREILAVLSRQSKPGRVDAANMILDLGKHGREDLARGIGQIREQQALKRRPLPSSMFGDSPLTIFCWDEYSGPRDETLAREYSFAAVMLAKNQERMLMELIIDSSDQITGIELTSLRPSSLLAHEREKIERLSRQIYTRRAEGNPKGKLGRNEVCPCGSGRKYKRCHITH